MGFGRIVCGAPRSCDDTDGKFFFPHPSNKAKTKNRPGSASPEAVAVVLHERDPLSYYIKCVAARGPRGRVGGGWMTRTGR